MPTEIKITGLDDANKLIRQIVARILDLTPALDAIGRTIVDSIQTNFEVGGRPAWPPLKPATVARKRRHPDKILIESETLKDSITHRVTGPRSVEVGTNVVYAPAHQFGLKGQVEVPAHTRRAHMRQTKRGAVRVRAHEVRAHQREMNLPARPFVVLQPEDIEEIRAIVSDFLLLGNR